MTAPFRVLPAMDEETTFFWTSGKDGVLRILQCQACRTYIHPPSPACPNCRSREVVPSPVSGRATVLTYTVNHQEWAPGPTPYVIAIVGLEEDETIRLTTNIDVDDVDTVTIGMPVRVQVEDHDPVYIPVFVPASDGNGASA